MKGTLRQIFKVFLLLGPILALGKNFQEINLPQSIKEKIESDSIISVSQVSDFENKSLKFQKMDFYITGLHRKTCSFALVKLSQYENYKKFLDFVTESSYDEKQGRINLLLETKILPTRMILNFKIPRINHEGNYPYEFDQGFLKGLKGTISVHSHKNRCFFYTDANFEGPHTSYPNFLVEFFSQTLAKIAMTSLFRISQTLK